MQTTFITYALSFIVLVICNGVQSQSGIVNIQPGSSPGVGGQLNILLSASGGVIIRGQITGLTPGLHGFHIHEKGALGNACKDAGPHFNPFLKQHGGPDHDVRHVGDLGNIVANEFGVANIEIVDGLASLGRSSLAYIGNRAVVVHAKPDDVGLGGNEESKKTGNAGERVGCGIIQLGIPQQNAQPSHHLEQVFPVGSQHAAQSNHRQSNGNRAFVRILPGSSPDVRGNLEVQEVQGGITVTGIISGLTPGYHGFHIHEKGDLSDQCKAALGHFNPFALTHGDPRDYQSRHVGDLGNILADNQGVARINIFDPLASFDPRNQAYVGNRAMVVHAKPDDLGRGGDAESKKTGNAGARVGCGIIEIQQQGESAIFFPNGQQTVPFPFVPNLGLHQQRRHRQIYNPSLGYGGYF